MAGKGGAKAGHIGASGGTVIPPHDLLTNPTGDGQRHLAVALAGGRGFKFCNTLLKISAAVVDEGPDQLTCGTARHIFSGEIGGLTQVLTHSRLGSSCLEGLSVGPHDAPYT